MNPLDQSLRRLFKAAARAPEKVPERIPGQLESRILAEWRRADRQDETNVWGVLLPRALMGACAVLLISIAWSLHDDRIDSAHGMTSVYQVVQESVAP